MAAVSVGTTVGIAVGAEGAAGSWVSVGGILVAVGAAGTANILQPKINTPIIRKQGTTVCCFKFMDSPVRSPAHPAAAQVSRIAFLMRELRLHSSYIQNVLRVG